jgi:hypothetical protein
MLVAVLVGVGMIVGVSVLRFPVPVFMRMAVNVLMGMQMLVFMIPLHGGLLSLGIDFNCNLDCPACLRMSIRWHSYFDHDISDIPRAQT